MAVPQDIFDKIVAESLPPDTTTSPERAQKGWSLSESVAQSGKELGSSFYKGMAGSADFFKGLLAGVVMPLIPEGDTPGAKLAWSILRPSMDTMTAEEKETRRASEAVVGKVVGPMAEGVGAMATMPILGGGVPAVAERVVSKIPSLRAGANALVERFGPTVGRNVISGAGMGEGAEIGKNVLGGLFSYIDPDLRKTGEATGSVLGGGVGGQLNMSRAAAAYELAKTPISAAKSAKEAFDSARAAKAAGDERNIMAIFADDYGNLRDEAKGVLSAYTDRKLASSIAKDIQAMSRVEGFKENVKTSGLETDVAMPSGSGSDVIVKPWGLAEQTLVPNLTREVRERQPKSYSEAENIDRLTKARQKSIEEAYNKIAGEKPVATAEGAEAAGNLFRTVTQAKVDALTTQQARVRDSFPSVNSSRDFELGETLRTQRDKANDASLGVARGKYSAAEQAFDAEGAKIGMVEPRAEVRKDLEEFIAKADPKQVPSILSTFLSATKDKPAPTSNLILPPGIPQPKPTPKELTLKEANDLVTTLNRAADDFYQAEKFQEFRRVSSLRDDVLSAIEGSPASSEAKDLFADARNYWRDVHAPQFLEGLGKALGKERGGAFEGREAVEGQRAVTRALESETSMRDFDRMFGNNPEARAAAREWIEGRYRRHVLETAKTPESFEIAVQKFKADNDHALSRFPSVADKIDQQSASSLKLMREIDDEVSRYKNVMSGPITQAVGPYQAQRLYANVLADPVKMDQLLAAVPKANGDVARQMVKEVFLQANPMKNGEYNAEALYNLLAAGKTSPAKQSSMEKLFTAAYGKEAGAKQMKALEALADLSVREAVTNPTVKAAGLMAESPVKEATGQTMASHIQAIRTQAAGNTGAGYAAILGLSRFANAKMQAALEKAKMRALYDPDTADAILQMAKTPPGKSIAQEVYGRVFGNMTVDGGKRFIDKLMDAGFVHSHVGRGVIYGTEKAMQDQQ